MSHSVDAYGFFVSALCCRCSIFHARAGRKLTAVDLLVHFKRLTAQLARTEEAAKRILTRSDPAAKGGVAQRLLDLEREARNIT